MAKTSPKKGIGHYSEDTTGAIDSLGCTWYYNWTPAPRKESGQDANHPR